MAAAVADFRPKTASPGQDRPRRRRADARAGADERHPRRGRATVARQSAANHRSSSVLRQRPGSLERARDKATRKGVDLLVANDVAEEGSGFGTDTNRVTLVVPGGHDEEWPLMTKRQVADRLLDRVVGCARETWPLGCRIAPSQPSSRNHARPADSPSQTSPSSTPTAQRIAMLTAYDYPTAKLVDEAGMPLILVGDSLAMVMLGYDSEIRVTVDQMLHHTEAVVRGAHARWSSATCPSCRTRRPTEAVENAGRFLQEAGAQAVKVEGGVRSARRSRQSSRRASRSWAHIGWTPQSKHAMGGKVRVQGKTVGSRARSHRRCVRGPGGWRICRRPRACSGRAGRGPDRTTEHSRRSASARGRTAPARFRSSRTCSAGPTGTHVTPRTSRTFATRSSRQSASMPPRSRREPSPVPSRPSSMGEPALDEVLGRSRSTGLRTTTAPWAAIPLDRDL